MERVEISAEDAALIAAILKEDQEELKRINRGEGSSNMVQPPPRHENDEEDDSGWTTVTYAKRNKRKYMIKKKPQQPVQQTSGDGGLTGTNDVVKDESDVKDEPANVAEEVSPGENSSEQNHKIDDGDYHADADVSSNDEKEEKKIVFFSEAAQKLDASHLSACLLDISATYKEQPDAKLKRFAEYFERAFQSVNAREFRWLPTMVDASEYAVQNYLMRHIPKDVCTTAFDWINQQPLDALDSFVLWLIESIFSDIPKQKKYPEEYECNTKAGIFVALGLTLRQKPDTLFNLVPILNDDPIYKGMDIFPVIVWAVCQVYPRDPAIGLYSWSHLVLPQLERQPNSFNREIRNWVLDIADRIFYKKETLTMLVNNPVRKGKRLVPPSAIAHFMEYSFLSLDAEFNVNRNEYTMDGFGDLYINPECRSCRPYVMCELKRVYKSLKKVALAGTPGSKEVKQIAQELFELVIEIAAGVDETGGEGPDPLLKEACKVLMWCLSNNPECYKRWDMMYLDNIKGSAVFIKRLSSIPREKLLKHISPNLLKYTLKSFRKKNAAALRRGGEADRWELFKDAEKYGKVLQVRLSLCCGYALKGVVLSVVMVCSAALISHKLDSWGMNNLAKIFNSA